MITSLKKEWMEIPEECFIPLRFGELKVGDKFISLPEPGGKSGLGLRRSRNVFIKNEHVVTQTKDGLQYHPDVSYGRATNMATGISSDLPHNMPVVLLELISQSSLSVACE